MADCSPGSAVEGSWSENHNWVPQDPDVQCVLLHQVPFRRFHCFTQDVYEVEHFAVVAVLSLLSNAIEESQFPAHTAVSYILTGGFM